MYIAIQITWVIRWSWNPPTSRQESPLKGDRAHSRYSDLNSGDRPLDDPAAARSKNGGLPNEKNHGFLIGLV